MAIIISPFSIHCFKCSDGDFGCGEGGGGRGRRASWGGVDVRSVQGPPLVIY